MIFFKKNIKVVCQNIYNQKYRNETLSYAEETVQLNLVN